MAETRSCASCSESFIAKMGTHIYCSTKCRNRANQERYNESHRQPCRRCGGNKPLGFGFQYCAGCAAIEKKERQQATDLRKRENRGEKNVGVRIKRQQLQEKAPPGTRLCYLCMEYVAIDLMATGRSSSYCKACNSEYQYDKRLQRDYGIDIVQYQQILELQNGVCAICHRPPISQRLAVDHNHTTGRVRGLLCTRCNHRVLGGAAEDVEILQRAVDYLKNDGKAYHDIVRSTGGDPPTEEEDTS